MYVTGPVTGAIVITVWYPEPGRLVDGRTASHPSIVDDPAAVISTSDDVVASSSPAIVVVVVVVVVIDVCGADTAVATAAADVPSTSADRFWSAAHAATLSDAVKPAAQSSRDALRDAPSVAATSISLSATTGARTSLPPAPSRTQLGMMGHTSHVW